MLFSREMAEKSSGNDAKRANIAINVHGIRSANVYTAVYIRIC